MGLSNGRIAILVLFLALHCTKTTSGGGPSIGQRPQDPVLAKGFDAAKEADEAAKRAAAAAQDISRTGNDLAAIAAGPKRMAQADAVVGSLSSKIQSIVEAYNQAAAAQSVAQNIASTNGGAQVYATSASASVQTAIASLRNAQKSAQAVMLVGYKPVPFNIWCSNDSSISLESRKTVTAIVSATGASSCLGVSQTSPTNLVLAKPPSGPLTDIKPLTSLSTAVSFLDLSENMISNVGPLVVMSALRSLNLNGNQVNQLTFASQLGNLEHLYLNRNPLLEVSSIAQLPKLTTLQVNGSGSSFVKDFHLLSEARNLTTLFIAKQNLTTLGFLTPMTKLSNLVATYNELTDVSPLAGLKSLRYLQLSHNKKLQDITPLSQLPVLEELRIAQTSVGVIQPLTKIKTFILLDLTGTPVPPTCPFANTSICQFNAPEVPLP